MNDRQENGGVTRLLRQQAALARFGSYAFREPELLNVLNEAARVCAEGLGVPFCKICRYREEEGDLLIEAGFGWRAGVVGLVVSRADETSPQGRAFVSGEPVILQDLTTAENVLLPPFYGEHGILSTVDVLIKGLDGEPYGVLEIDSPVQHTYDDNDVVFLTGFANVLAEAVATAQRNEMLQDTLEKMEALVAEKDMLLAERAMMAEELKHRVRNNLQLINAMLTSHLRFQTGVSEKASVNAIIRRVATLSEVYEQLLGSGMDRTIDLGDYLRSLCERLPGLQQGRNSEITLTCDAASLLADLDTVTALGMVVAELVANGYEHALPNGKGKIAVCLNRSDTQGEAILTVIDDGPGFVEESGSKRHGLGLVRRLVEQVRGTALLDGVGGTAWTFHFPVPDPEGIAASAAL
jgi:two-component sensor histidine kinase